MKKINADFITSICFFVTFVLFTVFISLIDVRPIGPLSSSIGFATLNAYVHGLTGVNLFLYNITDLLGLVPCLFCACFALIGLIQWIKRKSIYKVDRDILALGIIYIVTIFIYLVFEYIKVNYRPILISGVLEASYPSSTTVLTIVVMLTAVIELNSRIKRNAVRYIAVVLIVLFTLFMIIGRVLSGVHWFTDIIGGILLGASLFSAYKSISRI